MKLSIISEYALISLIHLARTNTAQTLAQISAAQQIPVESLPEIFSVLSRSNYVEQVSAGFQFVRAPSEISVAEIIRLFDGALAPLEPVSSKGYVEAPIDHEEKLSNLFEKIQVRILAVLEETWIGDLV